MYVYNMCKIQTTTIMTYKDDYNIMEQKNSVKLIKLNNKIKFTMIIMTSIVNVSQN